MKTTFNKLVGESRESLEIIDSHTLKTMIENKEDMAIIDVNDKEETDKRGMIQGAFNVSLGTLYYKADQEVPEDFKDNRIQDRDKKVVVTCGLGLCAAIGGKLLKDMGFKDVVLLEGGVEKWREDGYELEK
jgi:rhodanese-related sulfurtransferase|tara:strand:+ start:309 stop:701 length:393 start_codon:yes stop_codon:yes gene_type:complete